MIKNSVFGLAALLSVCLIAPLAARANYQLGAAHGQPDSETSQMMEAIGRVFQDKIPGAVTLDLDLAQYGIGPADIPKLADAFPADSDEAEIFKNRSQVVLKYALTPGVCNPSGLNAVCLAYGLRVARYLGPDPAR